VINSADAAALDPTRDDADDDDDDEDDDAESIGTCSTPPNASLGRFDGSNAVTAASLKQCQPEAPDDDDDDDDDDDEGK
jgi:hypothetical protein